MRLIYLLLLFLMLYVCLLGWAILNDRPETFCAGPDIMVYSDNECFAAGGDVFVEMINRGFWSPDVCSDGYSCWEGLRE